MAFLDEFQTLLADLRADESPVLTKFLQQWQGTGGLKFFLQLEQERDFFKEVLQINKALNSRQELAFLLALILDKAIEMVHAERGFIILSPDGNVAVARNFDKEWVTEPGFKISHSLAQTVLKRGQPIITGNAQQDPQVTLSRSVRQLALQSVLCVPLVAKEEVLGALYLDNRFCSHAFTQAHLEILTAFAEQVAIAIHNARLLEALQKRREEMEKLLNRLDEQVRTQQQELTQVTAELARKEEALGYCYHCGDLVSSSHCMQKVFHIAGRAAMSQAPVLIDGESGTGKGLLAQAIHNLGTQRKGAFIAENCAAIAESLLESELFGYVKGAFTGANSDHKGLFELADGGTLFLDEVGDMTLSMQAKLLRVLESAKIRPVGAEEWHVTDVRIIAATNKDLAQMVKEKTFREDLWYRLRVIAIHIPPLREHPEDIPILVKHFLSSQAEAVAKEIREVEPKALEMLCNYHWPGNIRQLEHEIKRIVAIKGFREKIRVEDLSVEVASRNFLYIQPRLPLKEAVRRFEYNYILQTINDTGGNKSEAAKALGVSRRSLYHKWSSNPEQTL